MKHLIFRIPLLLTMLLVSTIVIADDGAVVEEFSPEPPIYKSFEMRATTGMMYHKYAGPSYKKLSDNIPFVGIGTTLNFGLFSIDGYAQHSDKGKDGSFFIGSRGAINEDAKFYRDDYAITVGYKIGEPIFSFLPKSLNNLSFLRNFSVLAGYKWSETNIDVTQITLESADLTRTEIHFKTTGPFAGSGYIQPLGNHNMGMYVAYGKLTGDYSFSAFSGDQVVPTGQPDVISSTEAIRYGISLNGLLTKLPMGKFTYRLSLDGYDYTMDVESDKLDNFFVEEKVYSLNASLNWAFD